MGRQLWRRGSDGQGCGPYADQALSLATHLPRSAGDGHKVVAATTTARSVLDLHLVVVPAAELCVVPEKRPHRDDRENGNQKVPLVRPHFIFVVPRAIQSAVHRQNLVAHLERLQAFDIAVPRLLNWREELTD